MLVEVGDLGAMRLVGTQTGIWKPRQLSAALSILTGYYTDEARRPYEDGLGPDELLRYKWRGTDPDMADNRWLRDAMEAGLRRAPSSSRSAWLECRSQRCERRAGDGTAR